MKHHTNAAMLLFTLKASFRLSCPHNSVMHDSREESHTDDYFQRYTFPEVAKQLGNRCFRNIVAVSKMPIVFQKCKIQYK